MSQGWIRVIVLVLILLYLLPVWGFKYFPSVDGPSHIYNAHILNHLDHPAWIFKDYFELNLRPFPNWTGSLLMLALQKAASPLRAEKIFLTVSIILFIWALYYLLGASGHRNRFLTLFGFMFIYNLMFLSGFYSFCLGVSLLLLALGYFWKHKDAFTWKRGALLSLMLLAVYFSHPVPCLLAFAILGLFILLYYRNRLKKMAAVFLAMVPALAFFAYYSLAYRLLTTEKSAANFKNWPGFLTDFFSFRFLVTLDVHWQPLLASACAGLLALLFVWTAVRRIQRREPARDQPSEKKSYFLLAFGASFVLYTLLPDIVAGHASAINQRFGLVAALMILPWIPTDPGRAVRRAISVLAVGLALANLFVLQRSFSLINQELAEFTEGVDHMERGSTYIPLIIERCEPSSVVPYLLHAADYYGLNNGNVDLADYEANRDYFPLRFRKGIERPDVGLVIDEPELLDYARLSRYVRYILVCGRNPKVVDRVKAHYSLLWKNAKVRLFQSLDMRETRAHRLRRREEKLLHEPS
ncbi:MAG: hypothetical protein A2Y56_02180 [Candidatus Aminicenantes bacterium RBG_13_63_10]|nr:MAG: hypothetical protein A2Y56_02180 [Candidatus Aminicenantes bacterium RBG_13_63_10]